MVVDFGIPTNKKLTFGDVKVGQLFLEGSFIWLKVISAQSLKTFALPIIDIRNPSPSDFRYEYWNDDVKIDKIFDNYSITIKED